MSHVCLCTGVPICVCVCVYIILWINYGFERWWISQILMFTHDQSPAPVAAGPFYRVKCRATNDTHAHTHMIMTLFETCHPCVAAVLNNSLYSTKLHDALRFLIYVQSVWYSRRRLVDSNTAVNNFIQAYLFNLFLWVGVTFDFGCHNKCWSVGASFDPIWSLARCVGLKTHTRKGSLIPLRYSLMHVYVYYVM